MWSVNRPKIQTSVLLPNVEGKKALSDILRAYVNEKNKFNMDLRFVKMIDLKSPFPLTLLPLGFFGVRIPEGGVGGGAQSAPPPPPTGHPPPSITQERNLET